MLTAICSLLELCETASDDDSETAAAVASVGWRKYSGIGCLHYFGVLVALLIT